MLAAEANKRMEELLHGETHWLEGPPREPLSTPVPGGVSSDAEEAQLTALNDWVASLGLAHGEMNYDFADPVTGEQMAVFDLAWPNGIQEELSAPVASSAERISGNDRAGERRWLPLLHLRSSLRDYIEKDILALEKAA